MWASLLYFYLASVASSQYIGMRSDHCAAKRRDDYYKLKSPRLGVSEVLFSDSKFLDQLTIAAQVMLLQVIQ